MAAVANSSQSCSPWFMVMFPTVGPTCVVVLFRVLSIDMRCVAKAKERERREKIK